LRTACGLNGFVDYFISEFEKKQGNNYNIKQIHSIKSTQHYKVPENSLFGKTIKDQIGQKEKVMDPETGKKEWTQLMYRTCSLPRDTVIEAVDNLKTDIPDVVAIVVISFNP
ncbi:MAG: hypothetical protein V1647_05130, partial [Pseudomonadota bacterium]